MDKDQEISSTQRLLQHLRGRAKAGAPAAPAALTKGPQRSGRFSRLLSFGRRKGAIVGRRPALGIEVAGDRLNLVKMVPSAGHWRAEEAITVRLEPTQLPGTPDFVRVLRAQTARISGLSNCAVWALLPGARGDIWHIRVPKVKKGLGAVIQQVARADRAFDPATTLFDYRITGEVADGAVQKHRVECYSVNRQDLRQMTDAIVAAGLQPTGVTLSSYAVRNFLESRWLPNDGESMVALHIDPEHTYVNLFSGSRLVASRVIRTGLSAFTQAIEAGLKENRPKAAAQAPAAPPDRIAFPSTEPDMGAVEAAPGLVDDSARLASAPERASEPATGPTPDTAPQAGTGAAPTAGADESAESSESGLTSLFEQLETEGDSDVPRSRSARTLAPEQIFSWVEPVLGRILRQAELTVDHALSELGFASPSRLLFSGYGSTAPRFIDFMQSQLNIPVQTLEPLGRQANENASQVNSLGTVVRSRLTLTTGAAISLDEYTPNFLRTAADRDQEEQRERIGRYAMLGALVLVGGVAGLTFVTQQGLVELRRSVAMEQQSLGRVDRIADPAQLSVRAERLQTRIEGLRTDARRYAAVGLIGELIELTPEEIDLLNVRIEWPNRIPGSGETALPSIQVEGFVAGAEAGFDTRLSSYLFRLQASPLLATPAIRRSEIERFGREGRVMRFLIHVPSASL